MNREQVIKYAREAIEFNKTVRDKNNNALNAAIGLIEKHDGEYERGANDAWELARKIAVHPVDDGFTIEEIPSIFSYKSIAKIMNTYSFQEALAKVKAYEKKKEEEAAKPVLGDVVKIRCINDGLVLNGIFIDENNNFITLYTNRCGRLLVTTYPFPLWQIIEKTGEHVDIQGMLDKINE